MNEARFGFLAPLLEDPLVEEIIVLGGRRTFVVRGGKKELLPDVADVSTVRRIADQLLAGTGRRVDFANPIVSAQLPDGSRVHITGPPVTHPERINIQVRKFVLTADQLAELVELGSLSPLGARLLGAAVRADKTILVAGDPVPARPLWSIASSTRFPPTAGWSPARRYSRSKPNCPT